MATARAFEFEGWEKSEFPIVCETCLGDNPAIRMVRATCDRECRICNRACTGFRWQPGRKARYKTTIICQLCAKMKNVCQVYATLSSCLPYAKSHISSARLHQQERHAPCFASSSFPVLHRLGALLIIFLSRCVSLTCNMVCRYRFGTRFCKRGEARSTFRFRESTGTTWSTN